MPRKINKRNRTTCNSVLINYFCCSRFSFHSCCGYFMLKSTVCYFMEFNYKQLKVFFKNKNKEFWSFKNNENINLDLGDGAFQSDN